MLLDASCPRPAFDEADVGIAAFCREAQARAGGETSTENKSQGSQGQHEIGGVLKTVPEDFEVIERPLPITTTSTSEDSIEGSTIVRLWLRKRGIDSLEAVARIATLLQLPAKKIGIAGIKDSKAVTQQAITITLEEADRAALLRESSCWETSAECYEEHAAQQRQKKGNTTTSTKLTQLVLLALKERLVKAGVYHDLEDGDDDEESPTQHTDQRVHDGSAAPRRALEEVDVEQQMNYDTSILDSTREDSARLYFDRCGAAGFSVSNLEIATAPLFPGNLQGNFFRLRIRGCWFSSSPALEQAFTSLQNRGFVNYIGLQRFGKGGVRSDFVGFLYLKRDYVACFEALLYGCYGQGSSGSRGRPAPDRAASACDATSGCRPKPPWLSRFSRTGCAQTALRELGATTDGHLWLERRLLLAFAKCPVKTSTSSSSRSYEEKCRYAFLSLPRCIRVLYVHGYLDRLWNLAASERIRKYGAEGVVVGDCVQVRPSRSTKRGAEEDRLANDAPDPEVEPLLSSEEGAKNCRTSSSSSSQLLKRRRVADHIVEQSSYTGASDEGHSNHTAPGNGKAPGPTGSFKPDSNQSEEEQTFVKIIRTPAEAEKFSIFDVVLPRIGDAHLNSDLPMPENGVGQMMRDYLRYDGLLGDDGFLMLPGGGWDDEWDEAAAVEDHQHQKEAASTSNTSGSIASTDNENGYGATSSPSPSTGGAASCPSPTATPVEEDGHEEHDIDGEIDEDAGDAHHLPEEGNYANYDWQKSGGSTFGVEMRLDPAHPDLPCVKFWRIPGTYRNLLSRPRNLKWRVLGKTDAEADGESARARADGETKEIMQMPKHTGGTPAGKVGGSKGNKARVENETSKKHDLADIETSFELGPGQYATIAMRELLAERKPQPTRHMIFSDSDEE